MKKQLLQLLLCSLALVCIATMTRAYSVPIGAVGAVNTNPPLDTSSLDQIKSGGLSIGTFHVQGNSSFGSNPTTNYVLLNGLVRGGNATSTTPGQVVFGGTSNKVDVAFSGGVAIDGTFQSDTLKTGGGKKPLCANGNGALYICGTTPPSVPQAQTVVASAQFETFSAGQFVVAMLSQKVSKNVQVSISAYATGSGTPPPGAFLMNFYTAHARLAGTCYYTSTPTPLGTLTVYAANTDSSAGTNGGTFSLPSGCDSTNTSLIVTSVSPTSADGKNIIF
jgi:hypothetical protein